MQFISNGGFEDWNSDFVLFKGEEVGGLRVSNRTYCIHGYTLQQEFTHINRTAKF